MTRLMTPQEVAQANILIKQIWDLRPLITTAPGEFRCSYYNEVEEYCMLIRDRELVPRKDMDWAQIDVRGGVDSLKGALAFWLFVIKAVEYNLGTLCTNQDFRAYELAGIDLLLEGEGVQVKKSLFSDYGNQPRLFPDWIQYDPAHVKYLAVVDTTTGVVMFGHYSDFVNLPANSILSADDFTLVMT